MSSNKKERVFYMRSVMNIMKPLDIVIIVVLIAISFIPLTVFSMTNTYNEGDDIIAVVSQDGVIIQEITLTGHQESEQFRIEGTGDQYNTIEVENERIRILHDNTPYQVGVNMGWKDTPGETIISLPHKLLIEITSQSSDADDPIIISY